MPFTGRVGIGSATSIRKFSDSTASARSRAARSWYIMWKQKSSAYLG